MGDNEEVQTCPVCDGYGHDWVYCPVCKKPFSCPDNPVYIGEHISSDECASIHCPTCGLVNKGEHNAPCKTCGAVKGCPGNPCPKGCCSSCGLKAEACHCNGPCSDPNCKLLAVANVTYKSGFPQHKEESLKAYGLLHEDGTRISLYDQAVIFYTVMAVRDGSKSREIIAERIIKKLADSLVEAILLACSGEVRYTNSSLYLGAAALSDAAQFRRAKRKATTWVPAAYHYAFEPQKYNHSRPYGMGKFYKAGDNSGWPGGRTGSARLFREHVINTHGKKHAARLLRNAFMLQYFAQGKGGVGGPLWAKAADIAYRFLRGDLSPTMFVDTAFDLQHNNAVLFTKSHRLTQGFDHWLDKRQNADDAWILNQAPEWLLKEFGVKPPKTASTCTWDMAAVPGGTGLGVMKLNYIEPVPVKSKEKKPVAVTYHYTVGVEDVAGDGLKVPAMWASKTNQYGGVIQNKPKKSSLAEAISKQTAMKEAHLSKVTTFD